MAEIILLGSAAAIPDASHANSQMLLKLPDRAVLIDCSDNTYLRLASVDVGVDQVSDLILTHFHPDHTGGVPAYLITLWLLKRRMPMVIHGLKDTLHRTEEVMHLYQWESWKDFYPVSFKPIGDQELIPVMTTSECELFSSPVCHLIPTIGLRMEFTGGSVVAYSSDSQPCDSVVRLARDADLLFHEAAGLAPGHSSGEQAADIARQAGVKKLVLIHYAIEKGEEMLNKARLNFSGEIELAQDGTVYKF